MSTTRPRMRPDGRLAARMALTLFLLGLVYVAFVTALFLLVKSVVLIVAIAGGVLLAQFWFADRIALYGMRARIVTADEEPYLHGVVDRLCASANMPKPRIAVADNDLPNAFATGRSSRRAVLCVTTGLTGRLDTDELSGVLAHELSHIAHRDVAVMTAAAFLGVLAGLVARFAFYSTLFGGRGRRDQNLVVVILLVMGVSMAVYAISFVLIRALSRYRELAADAGGAMLTGQPTALASALVKVTGAMGRIPTRDLRSAEAFNAFFFAPATCAGLSLSRLFATHPPLRQRLDRLDELAKQLQEPS